MEGFDVAALSHRGAVREHNEDTIGIADRVLTDDLDEPFAARLGGARHLLVVADGMGGHTHGELASRTAVESLNAFMNARAPGVPDEADWRDALASVNTEIYQTMQRRPETAGMGTTIVGAVIGPDGVIHFNVGDSRAYLLESSALRQISQDDVPVPGGAGRHRVSHALTQCLGGHPSPLPIEPHVGTLPALAPGQTLLLCSDGLTDMVEDEEIARTLEAMPDPATAVEALFAGAMERGGVDNISIVIVRPAAGRD